MATKQLSATVSTDVYEQFEVVRKSLGEKRSRAVEDAIRLYLKTHDDALIAEGCRQSAKDDLDLAAATREKSLKALARTL